MTMMGDTRNLMSHLSDDEDEEDLEFLRSQALKTLHSKKDNLQHSQNKEMHYQSSTGINKSPSLHLRSDRNKIPLKIDNFYRSSTNYQQVNQRLNNIDLNDTQKLAPPSVQLTPYSVTPWMHPNPTNGYPSAHNVTYNTSTSANSQNLPGGINIKNVQLSPRSLAFVAQNNNILMRRKGGSPSIYRSSPQHYRDPSPYRAFSPRWSSISPPPLKNRSRSPRNRIEHYRRSSSPSPPPRNSRPGSKNRSRSPVTFHRRRSLSRSPGHQRFPRSRSPLPQHSKRLKSRTPPGKTFHRERSPIRRRSPIDRYKRSPNYRKTPPSRNRSPAELIQKRKSPSPAIRNRSRSPTRRFQRKSSRERISDRNFKDTTNSDRNRRSPGQQPRRRIDRFRNRNNRVRRSLSPRKVRSRSRDRKDHRRDNINRDGRNDRRNNITPSKNEKDIKTEKPSTESVVEERAEINYPEIESLTPPCPMESLTPPIVEDKGDIEKMLDKNNDIESKIINNTKGQELTDEETNSSDDDDGDGIDLFPSEESESENEGRFKTSSNSNERSKVPSLSFAKLNETSKVPSLKELCDDDDPKQRNGRKRYDYKGRRNEKRRAGASRRSRTPDHRRKLNEMEEKIGKNGKASFKSTFQIIEGEGRTKSDLKKRLNDREDSLEKARSYNQKNSSTPPLPPQFSISQKKDKSESSIVSSSRKKSIHSRLGAMTNTFKPSKKYDSSPSSSTSNKV